MTDSRSTKLNADGSLWVPRTVIVSRTEQGFGFTLRHFIVYPPDTTGQENTNDENHELSDDPSQHGKLLLMEPMDTIFVKQVKEGGPAYQAGLHTGDRIVSVNGETVTGKSYPQVIALIQSSNTSLKLLVVPKDEDVLQMAYKNSVYTHNQQAYTGYCDVGPPQFGQHGRSSSDTHLLAGKTVHIPPPRYKSELQMLPEDQNNETQRLPSRGRYVAVAQDWESDSFITPKHLSDQTNTMTHTAAHTHNSNPPAPKRTSSKSIVLNQYPESNRNSSTATEASTPSSYRTRDAVNRFWRNKDIAAEPKNHNPTRSSMPQSTSSTASWRHRDNDAPKKRFSSNSRSDTSDYIDPRIYTSSAYIDPPHSQPVNNNSGGNNTRQESRHDSRHRASYPSSYPTVEVSYNPSPQSDTDTRTSGGGGYGATFMVRFGDHKKVVDSSVSGSGSVHHRHSVNNVTQYRNSSSVHRNTDVCDNNQLYYSETDDSYAHDSEEEVRLHYPPHHPSTGSTPSTTPASSTPYSTPQSMSPPPVQGNVRHRKTSHEVLPTQRMIHRSRTNSLPHTQSSRDSPATINIYFRGDQTPPEKRTPELYRSPVHMRHSHSPYSPYGTSHSRSLSPDELNNVCNQLRDAQDERMESKARRKPSYLSAVNSPRSKSVSVHDDHHPMSPKDRPPNIGHSLSESHAQVDSPPAVSPSVIDSSTERVMWQSSVSSTSSQSYPESTYTDPDGSELITVSSAGDGSGDVTVIMRQNSAEDRDAKLKRRTSYLMATNKDAPAKRRVEPLPDATDHDGNFLSKPDYGQPPMESSRVQLWTRIPHRLSDISETPTAANILPEIKESMLNEQNDNDDFITPTKTSIRKLKAFFGEKTPRIMEATTERARVCTSTTTVSGTNTTNSTSNGNEIIKEGLLNIKLAVMDGKRASDRSWKPVWICLRGHCLYQYKDKATASASVGVTPIPIGEDQPISIKSSIVDIAYDYTKKKHVLRLTTYNGSEYLFQAEDHEDMLDWIHTIQGNNNPDDDEGGIVSSDLILRKTTEYEHHSAVRSPQVTQKTLSKKSSSKSLRAKSPATSHSPGTMKYYHYTEGPRTRDLKESKETNKTWKGKMVQKFRRYGSSSTAPVEVSGTFGVPLELCPMSVHSEHVPFVVDVCIRIVEERGLENQGIYRVPGNTGAVNMLQEELNKYGDETVIEGDDRWLDVNVVSSLLKSFFRKLPEPVITHDLYEPIINANRIENPERRMLMVKKLLHELPETYFETFRYIAKHLNTITNNDTNKMDARNLAIVFGPTLVRTMDESMITMVKDMSDQCRLVESIILHYDWFFSSWDVDNEVPIDKDMNPVSTINQELINKAENMVRGENQGAKEIMSSLLSAANLRKKKKDKSSKSIDISDGGDGELECKLKYGIHSASNTVQQVHESVSRSSFMSSVMTTNVIQQGAQPLNEGATAVQGASSLSESAGDAEQGDVHGEMQGNQQEQGSVLFKQTKPTSYSTSSLSNQSSSTRNTNSSHLTTVGPRTKSASSLSTSYKQEHHSAKMMFLHGNNADDMPDWKPALDDVATDIKFTRYPAIQPQNMRLVQTENAKPVMHTKKSPTRVSPSRMSPSGMSPSGMSPSHSAQSVLQTPSSSVVTGASPSTLMYEQCVRHNEQQSEILRRKEASTLAEQAKYRENKQRIEAELEKTQREIDLDDDYIDTSQCSVGTVMRNADNASVTSDYSTMTSVSQRSTYTSRTGASDYSSFAASPASVRSYTSPPGAHGDPGTLPGEGGRYFGVNSTPTSNLAIFNTRKVANKGTLTRKKSHVSHLPHGDDLSPPWKGSLDSLRELYTADQDAYVSDSSDTELMESVLHSKIHLLGQADLGHGTSYHRDSSGSYNSTPKTSRIKKYSGSEGSLVDSIRPSRGASSTPSRVAGRGLNAQGHVQGVSDAHRKLQNTEIEKHSPPTVNVCASANTCAASMTSDSQRNASQSSHQKREQWLVSKTTTDYTRAIRASMERFYTQPTEQNQNAQPKESESHKRTSKNHKLNRKHKPRRHTVGGTDDLEHIKALLASQGNDKSGGDGRRASAWERLQPVQNSGEFVPKSMDAWLRKQRLSRAGSSPALFNLALQPWQIHSSSSSSENSPNNGNVLLTLQNPVAFESAI